MAHTSSDSHPNFDTKEELLRRLWAAAKESGPAEAWTMDDLQRLNNTDTDQFADPTYKLDDRGL